MASGTIHKEVAVQTYELTDQTNMYGNFDIPTTIVRPSTGEITSASTDGNIKAIVISLKTSDKYILRFFDYATTNMNSVTYTNFTCTLRYFLY